MYCLNLTWVRIWSPVVRKYIVAISVCVQTFCLETGMWILLNFFIIWYHTYYISSTEAVTIILLSSISFT